MKLLEALLEYAEEKGRTPQEVLSSLSNALDYRESLQNFLNDIPCFRVIIDGYAYNTVPTLLEKLTSFSPASSIKVEGFPLKAQQKFTELLKIAYPDWDKIYIEYCPFCIYPLDCDNPPIGEKVYILTKDGFVPAFCRKWTLGYGWDSLSGEPLSVADDDAYGWIGISSLTPLIGQPLNIGLSLRQINVEGKLTLVNGDIHLVTLQKESNTEMQVPLKTVKLIEVL